MRNIVGALVCVLLLASCTQGGGTKIVGETQVSGSGVESTQVATVLGEEVRSVESVVASLSDTLKGNEGFQMCFMSNIDMCSSDMINSKDSDLSCDEFVMDANKTNCEENKIMMQAKQELDIGVCEKIQGDSSACKFEVVVEKGDLDVCADLNESYKIPCNNSIIISQALENNDENLCDKVLGYSEEDTMEQDMCREQIEFMSLQDRNQDAVIQGEEK